MTAATPETAPEVLTYISVQVCSLGKRMTQFLEVPTELTTSPPASEAVSLNGAIALQIGQQGKTEG
jgi:hypothetical protein